MCNEEWDRRKRYLIRSLFDDVPVLSPISERPELSTEIISPRRPFSPLPDLIIEKERYKHDDPEEYYQHLEKKVLKLYRKLFSKTRLDFNEDSGEFSSDNVPTAVAEECEEISIGTKGKQSECDSIGTEDTPEQSKTKSASTSTSPLQTVTVTQAEVHCTENVETTKAISADGIPQSEIELPVAEPEIMRRRETIESMNSIHVLNDDIFFAADVTHKTISRDMDEGEKSLNLSGIGYTSTPNIAIQEEDLNKQDEYVIYKILSEKSSDENSLSPKRRRLDPTQMSFNSKEDDNRQDMDASTSNIQYPSSTIQVCTQGRNVLNEKSPDLSKSTPRCREFNNLAAQTSFSSDDVDWQDIKKRFFIGVPRIYKLCSCRNHVCS